MQIDFNNTNFVNEAIRILGILLALFHFLVGFVLVSRVTSMEKIFKTKNNTLFIVINFGYLFFLGLIILLIVLN